MDRRQTYIYSALLFLHSLCISAIYAQEEYELRTAEDVSVVLNNALSRLGGEPRQPKPRILVVQPKQGNWSTLHEELIVSLSRYGVGLDGILVESTQLDAATEARLAEKTHAVDFAVQVNPDGGGKIGLGKTLARFFGMQGFKHHFQALRRFYKGENEEQFRWLNTVPHGFGGGARKQFRYLYISVVNTSTFWLAHQTSYPGVAEGLIFGLTYAFNAGADYLNYLRLASRKPRWETDRETGETQLNADVQQTYSRPFYFLVTWAVLGGSNLVIMLPVMAETGDVRVGLWRVFTNSLLNVFSVAAIDGLFAILRKKQLDSLEAEKQLLVEVETDQALSAEEKMRLTAEAQRHATAAKVAESRHMNWRVFYYGTLHPFIKNSHLVGDGVTRLILVAVGAAGVVADAWKNGTRLWSNRSKQISLPTANLSCPLRLFSTNDQDLPLLRALFLPPREDEPKAVSK